MELFVVGLVVGVWLGYKLGYTSAVRHSGWSNFRSGFRRWRTGRW